MVTSILAISLLGLGAVQALPANLQDRQSFSIAPPTSGGAISPGPACDPNVPPEQQGACLYTPVTGEMKPSPKKRAAHLNRRDQEFGLYCDLLYGLKARKEGDLRVAKTLREVQSLIEELATIRALLNYCPDGEPTSGTITPVPVISGGPLVPNPTYPGGAINPVPTGNSGGKIQPVPTSVSGGWIQPVPTIPGGSMNPTKRSIESALEDRGEVEPVSSVAGGEIEPQPTVAGGEIEPVTPSTPGGWLEPIPTIPGGEIEPATKRSTEEPEPRDIVAELKDGVVWLGNPQVGKITPVKPIPGGKLVPVPTTPGGKIRPATRSPVDDIFKIGKPEVGKLVPVKPVPGGKLVPVTSIPGGKLVPVTPIQGGKLVPVAPTPGGKIRPATRSAEDDGIFIIGKPEVGKLVPVKPTPGGKLKPAT